MRATEAAAAPLTQRWVFWIQGGLAVLVAVMPFHAFLSVWLGHLVGHEAVWQSWKELLLLILTGLSLVLVRHEPTRLRRWQNPLVYGSLAFVVVGLIITLLHYQSLTTTAFGLKTDTEFLLAMLLALLVADARWLARLVRIVVISSGIVIVFGLLQVYVLPANWLAHFGYGPTTIQPFLRVDPAIPAIRILSTLGGPNQLGSFLLLPLSLVIWKLLIRPRWWQPLYLLAGLVILWHTYSRSALLGFAGAAVVVVALRVRRVWRLPLLLAALILAAIGLQVTTLSVASNKTLKYYVFHETLRSTGISASTDQHSLALKNGLHAAEHHPLGLGFGSAGPASFHSTNPDIPENYYLQIAIETGVVGLLLFVAVELSLGWRLARLGSASVAGPPLLGALVGIAVINVFLQGWADSSTALIFWSLAGAVVGARA